ncbi:MAG: hypothetical protein A2X64_07650 [Ignavibacteria bacterium GWF2_33_9]|nr:MAG: hypothetical protein A2X64_07650 [Ignavibacteria bacterium GWF2_33_9]
MNIGIIGATGFLGSYLLDYLCRINKYNIHGFSRNPMSLNKKNSNINWIIGNLSSEYDCKEFIKNVDIIIHLAHTNTPLTSNNDVISDVNLNLIPMVTLLETIKKYGKKIHLVYVSSGGAIYGQSADKTPFKEFDLCLPKSSYGIQKLVAENYIRLWAEKSLLTSTILRISNPYGILLPTDRKQGLIGVVLSKLLKNDSQQIYGDSNNIRDYIHLEDMSKAFELAIEFQNDYEIFNIGSGKGYSVNDIFSLIEQFTSIEIKKNYIELDNSNKLTDWVVLDTSKAEKILNWTPSISLETGLKTLCDEVMLKR